MDSQPTVAHFMKAYLDISDTFIYQYLRNLRQYRPVLFVEETENLELFPLDASMHRLADVWQRGSWKWLRGRIDRAFGKDPALAMAGRILARGKPALIHAHFGPQGVWALPLKRRYGVPLVTTFYGIDMSKLPKQPEWRDAYQTLFAEGDRFLVEGPHMRKRLVELGCPLEKISIQHIGIDSEQITFAPRTMPRKGPIRLLLCGRFTEKKGIEYGILAMDLVRSRCDDVELRIVGDGDLRRRIEQLIADLDLKRHVNLLGYQPHARFAEELRLAHIFLAPSVTAADGDSEGGAPTVLLEAQASGLPIVSTHHADIPEVVVDGKSAFLAPEREPEALAEHILHLAQNPSIWLAVGQAGREHVEQNHSIVSEARKLEHIYTDVVQQNAPEAKEVHDGVFVSETR